MRGSITTTTRTQCRQASGSKATGRNSARNLSRPSRSSSAPSLSKASKSNAAPSLSRSSSITRPWTRRPRHRHSPSYLSRVHTPCIMQLVHCERRTAQRIHMSFCTAFFAGTVKCCGDRPHHQEGGGSRRDADQQGMYIRGAAMRSLEPNHVCLVLALSHIKSPQPKVSEYAWALCYPPSP